MPTSSLTHEHPAGKTEGKRGRGRLALILALTMLFVCFLLPFGVTVFLYEQFFGARYETSRVLCFCPEDFDGLTQTRYSFPSNKGQALAAYLYAVEGTEPRGLLVMAHGLGGGGHNSYMDCASFFAHNGFLVLAFDATRNDESEGRSVGGIPQGVIDLSYALSFAKTCPDIPELPIFLFGHSWGAYCASAVLVEHPEVKAVAALSGFNRSSDMLQAQGEELVGGWSRLLLPYVKLYDFLKFGAYAQRSAMDGFRASDAAVLVIHDAEDGVVPPRYGYELYAAAFSGDPRFSFLLTEGKGHDMTYSPEIVQYLDKINLELIAWADSLSYDRNDAANAERFAADKRAWIDEHFDREFWRSHSLDTELFEQILRFYAAQLEN